MNRNHQTHPDGQAGYAILTVMIFALVVVIAGIAFFAMSSYETKGAIYRQDSSEAFYLADGAVERARAKFLEDRTWRTGWAGETEGRGEYDLAVVDTTFMGEPNVVQLLTEGRVGQAARRIEVMASVPPTAYGLSILVMGDADVNGNLCLDQTIHVNGDPDFGPNNVHLQCGTFTSGFEITPPPIYTDPGHYPDATYYYVRGNIVNGIPQARIFNDAGVDLTTALGDSLIGLVAYNNGQKKFTYYFNTDSLVTHYFDDSLGVFHRASGDRAVVVNFGEPPVVSPPGVNGITSLEIQGAVTTRVHTTVINTRFTGVTEEQRIDADYWTGGLTLLKQAFFEPYYGIALIAYDFQKVGGALARVGTEEWPALVYVTQDVVDVNSNFALIGAITVLGDWHSTGGPDITWDPGFLENLPGYLVNEWPNGVSGSLQVLRWKELPGP